MRRWDDVKKLGDAGKTKIEEARFSALAGDAVLGAQRLAGVAEAVAKRSGLTKQNGEISKLKVAKAAVQPRKAAMRVFNATADELRTRQEVSTEGQPADSD